MPVPEPCFDEIPNHNQDRCCVYAAIRIPTDSCFYLGPTGLVLELVTGNNNLSRACQPVSVICSDLTAVYVTYARCMALHCFHDIQCTE